MSEQWDFYFCQVDGKPASIFLDLGIAPEAPVAGYGQLMRVDLTMLAPQPDGLSSELEFKRLTAIEDALGGEFAQDAHYTGRVTCNGHREFYIYLGDADADAGPRRVAAAMASFPEYAYTTQVRADPEWEAYLEFLYPDDAARHSISNRHVCDALVRNGDCLELPREIDHWAYFPDAVSRDIFIRRAGALGYALREVWGPDENTDAFAVQVFRTDMPGFDSIDEVTHALLYLAEELGGEYDGWECQVVREAVAPL